MRRVRLFLVGVAAAVALGAVACAPSGAKTLVAEFTDVGDLVGRANVQQSDAVIGTVRSIDLVEREGRWLARVEMRIRDGVQVADGSTAVVRSTSLLGEKYVDLVAPPGAGAGDIPDGGTIPSSRTDKAPELEDLFSPLGAILQGGALEDLARLSTATAMILEGQEENVGRVIDGTAKLVSSLRRERESLAAGFADLGSAASTLASGSGVIDRALDHSDEALRIVADQRRELEDLVVHLDRLAGPLAQLTRDHKDDVDAQVRAVRTIVPKLHEARGALEAAVEKLPDFTKLFAEAIPGDYVQLNVLAEALPIDLGGTAAQAMSLETLLLEAVR